MINHLHNTFGGIIYSSDFNTNRKETSKGTGSSVAARILADKRFDEECKKNVERRQNNA